jgi:hypothetical protein
MDGKTHPLFYGSCIMPIYEFEDTNTGERLEKFLSFSGKDDFLKENPHIEQRIFTAPADVGGVGDRVKPDSGMNEVFSRIGAANPDSPMGERYHRKTTKEVKTRAVVKKHLDLQGK